MNHSPNVDDRDATAMGYRFSDLIDIEQMQELFDNYCAAVGVAAMLIEADGTLILDSNRKRICVDFHEENATTCAHCIKHNAKPDKVIRDAGDYSYYQCRNGLIEVSAPILVEGEPLAEFFVGQFLLEPPDRERFREQAREFGFDEADYLAALDEIPVVSEKRIDPIMRCLAGFSKSMAQAGLDGKRRKAAEKASQAAHDELERKVEERAAELREGERRFRAIFDQTMQLMGVLDVDGRVVDVNQTALKMAEVSKSDLIGLPFEDTPYWRHSPELQQRLVEAIERARQGESSRFEATHIRPNGDERIIDFTLTPIRNEAGKVILLIPMGEDITETHRARRMLKRTQFTVDHQSLPIIWVDLTGRIEWVNEAYSRLVKYERAELMEMTVHDVSPDFSVEVWGPHVEEIKRVKSTVLETNNQTKEGDVFPVEVHTNYFESGDSDEAGWICAQIIDISERKAAEESLAAANDALRQSEHRATAILNSSFQLQGLIDTDGRLLEANRAALSMIGAVKEDLEGMLFWDCPWWDRNPEIQQQIRDAIHQAIQGEAIQFFATHPAPDGVLHHIDFRITPFKNDEGKVVYLIPEGHDITELKEAEVALKFTQYTVDHAPDASFWIRPSDAGFEYVNERTCETLGYSREELLDMRVPDIDPDFPITRFNEQVDFLRTGKPVTFESRHRTKQGRTFPVEISTYLVEREGRELMVAFVRDIEERKQAEEDLHRAKETAEAANRAKSVFLSNMSHELRTPLNAILGFTQLMEHDKAIPEGRREELGIIGRSGRHLLGLINDVLDIAKIEAGHAVLAPNAFDLIHFLRGIAEMFHSRAQAKSLEFLQETHVGVLKSVMTDEGKLRQVLINLLGNAVKFTDRGEISFRIQIIEPTSHEPAQPPTSWIRFEVEDTGPGIPDDRIDHVFDPFVQAGVHTGEKTGTGLGLAICHQYVELMGGRVGVESELGKGTLFWFEIPIEQVDESQLESEGKSARVIGLAPDQPEFRILIAEDREESRILLGKLLHSIGFEVRETSNGAEAVDAFESWHPHLVWMDMRMPVMDGIEATHRIKQTEAGENTPVIALTAHAFEEECQEFLKAGCDDFVRKPYQEHDLFDKMAKHLHVEYVYDQPEPTGSANHEKGHLTATDLKALPAETLHELHECAVCGSIDKMELLIAQIQSDHPQQAEILTDLLAEFDFQPIIQAAETAENESEKGEPAPS